MRVILQRVSNAQVVVDDTLVSAIDNGFLVLLGVGHEDTAEDMQWLVRKILNMRVFSDEDGKMNKSIIDIQGELLVVSQFTLYASTKKGNRPSFINSAKPDIAKEQYESFCTMLQSQFDGNVKKGIFAADMKVSLTNDGPVTILLDSKNKE